MTKGGKSMAIKNQIRIIMLSAVFLISSGSLGYTQSRIETQAIKTRTRQIIRDNRARQRGFLSRIRSAIRDLKSKQRQLKMQAAQNKLMMRKNRDIAREAQKRSRIQQRESRLRVKQAMANNKLKIRELRDKMRR